MQYIHLRNKTYHFRFVIPLRFRHLYPYKEIKRSLRTDSYSIAVSRLANHFPVIHQINQLIAPCDHVAQLINHLRHCQLSSVITPYSAVYEPTASLQRALPIPPAMTSKVYLLEDAWADFIKWKSWDIKVESGAKRYFEFIKCCLGNVAVTQVTKQDIKSLLNRYVHDTKGNVTSNGIYNFSYDLANQPTTTGSNTFVYDGNLKRVKKIVNSKVIYSVYTKEAGLVSQYNKSSGLHTDYIRLSKQLIARVESAGSIADSSTVPFNDTIGSLPSSGLTGRNFNLPFGKSIGNANNSDSAIGFTGHVKDSTGLTYMQARYYDPVIGRFYSNDPLDVKGHIGRGNPVHGFNRYTYANNNPYKYTDPDGEFGIVGFAIGFAADAIAQYATTGKVDVKQSLISGAVGAVTGGLASAARASMAIGGKIVATAAEKAIVSTSVAAQSAVVGAAGYAVNNSLNGKEVTASGVTTNAVLSTLGLGAATASVVKTGGSIVKSLANGADGAVIDVATEAVAQTASKTVDGALEEHTKDLENI